MPAPSRSVSHRRGLRPERADHRRHVRRIVHHRLGERARLRLVPFDVQADHLGHHRQVARDRPPPGTRAAGRGAREPPSAPTREPTCRAGTRSSRARGRERATVLAAPPVHAEARVATRATRTAAVEGRRLMSVRVATHTGTRGRMGSLGPRRDGGTGRRAGLKIPWASAREGSTPSPGTHTTRPSTTRSPRVEPIEPQRGDVDGARPPVDDELREELADDRRVLEPVAAEPVRQEQSADGRLADDRVPIGRHLVQARPHARETRVLDRREHTDRRRQQLLFDEADGRRSC